MGDKTGISWTDRTLNFWMGCRHVSPGCDHCYAEAMINRTRGAKAFDTIVKTKTWGLNSAGQPLADPARWQREAEAANRYDRVFTCSLSDFFIQDADQWRTDAWKVIRSTPNLIYQILTKRPDLIKRRLPFDWGANGYENVWLGVSVESKLYLKRMDVLREIPAHVRFVSAEPLIEDICPELKRYVDGFHQIIVGGESGNGTKLFRPMPTEWARRILKVCRENNIAFFFKQSSAIRTEMGTQLDGVTYYEYPEQLYKYGKQRTGLFK